MEVETTLDEHINGDSKQNIKPMVEMEKSEQEHIIESKQQTSRESFALNSKSQEKILIEMKSQTTLNETTNGSSKKSLERIVEMKEYDQESIVANKQQESRESFELKLGLNKKIEANHSSVIKTGPDKISNESTHGGSKIIMEFEKSDQERIAQKIGKISMHFFENFAYESVYPESYYTLSSKERLLLLFAENFRRQYQILYEKRMPLMLAVENECGVKKFVSTTIRPSTLLYPELIGNWMGPAQFVADFITFEPLKDPIAMVSHYFSILTNSFLNR